MRYVFIIAAILQFIHVLRRRVDLLSVGAVCHIIYNIYCATGIVFVSSHEHAGAYYYYSAISVKAYIIVLLQMILISIAMSMYDRRSHVDPTPLIQDNYSKIVNYRINMAALFIVWAIMLYNVMRIGFTALTGSKSSVWSMVSGLYITGNWLGMAVFTYGLKEKKPVLSTLGLAPVLLHIFIGSRAYFAASCIVFLLVYSDQIGNSLKKRWKVIVLAFLVFVFILAYKKMYTLVKAGELIKAVEVLFDPETYAFVFRLGEPRIVLANLNYILEHNIHLGLDEGINRVIAVVPFINNLIKVGSYTPVSSVLQSGMESSYGLASNIWGEFYALGYYPLLLIMFLLWLRILTWGNGIIKRTDWSSNFALPIIAYFAFYIHRLDFVKAIGNVKMVLMGMIIYVLLGCFFSGNTKIAFNTHNSRGK